MMNITGIQIIGIIIAAAVFWQARAMFKEGKFKKLDFFLWAGVSFALIIVSIFPRALDASFKYLQINRALDGLIVLGVFGAYILIFVAYIRIQETQREITEVVRKVALKFEEKEKNKNKKK
ncbi:MAG: DUF2304 family protein [Candidatus Undinarchaeales archaeon]